MYEEVLKTIEENRIIAIVRGLDHGYTDLAKALYNGGIRVMELTYNLKEPDTWKKTAQGISDIRTAMRDKMCVGAGTVVSVEMVEMTKQAGGQFVVSPDTNIEVIKKTKKLGMVSLPGAMTPTEILTAHNAGADFVKVFPAGHLGPAYIKALKGPLNHIKLLAVGGVSSKNVSEFIAAGCSGAGVGGNLVNIIWIEASEWNKITATAKELVDNLNV